MRHLLVIDDILQEVWIAAYRTITGFQPAGPGAVDRWLITITHSKLVDAVRYARRAKRGGDRRYIRDSPNCRPLRCRVFSPDSDLRSGPRARTCTWPRPPISWGWCLAD